MGFGLHIASEIILAHGGSLQLGSSAVAGKTFFVKLSHSMDYLAFAKRCVA
jgi:C4-dicarboxylate-specific signal transduction histidine kinase